MSAQQKILIADDDNRHRDMLATLLADWGYAAITAKDGVEAITAAQKHKPDMILLDARMPRMDGYTALTRLHADYPDIPIIMMTAYSDVAAAVEAIRNGAWDYLTKPLDFDKLRVTLRNAAERLGLLRDNAQLAANLSKNKSPMLGISEPMLKLAELIKAVAPSEATCLITGESGTGKELAARAIHAASRRANGPFVAINCGALTESLLASELFGHEKGAFTGADKTRDGLFSQANGGTIFLDEIGEMPLAMQVQLLRALQEREIIPVGASKPVPIDCRVIAASNRDLAKESADGKFREDLFYRLNVVNIKMPPLRERKDDIPLLASHFASRFAAQNGRNFTSFSPSAINLLTSWNWPGNVRELENVMERAIILMTGNSIGERELPEHMLAGSHKQAPNAGNHHEQKEDADGNCINIENQDFMPVNDDKWPTLEEVEKKVILETLRRMGNNKTEAAKALGITRKTLHARLNRYKDGES